MTLLLFEICLISVLAIIELHKEYRSIKRQRRINQAENKLNTIINEQLDERLKNLQNGS